MVNVSGVITASARRRSFSGSLSNRAYSVLTYLDSPNLIFENVIAFGDDANDIEMD